MKKILILGGTLAQVIAIETTKKMASSRALLISAFSSVLVKNKSSCC